MPKKKNKSCETSPRFHVQTSVNFDSFPVPLDESLAGKMLQRVYPQLRSQARSYMAQGRVGEIDRSDMGTASLSDPGPEPEEIRCIVCDGEIVRREAKTFGNEAVGPGDSVGEMHHTCAAGHCVAYTFITTGRTTLVYADRRPEAQ
jgi:hypothetical protein